MQSASVRPWADARSLSCLSRRAAAASLSHALPRTMLAHAPAGGTVAMHTLAVRRATRGVVQVAAAESALEQPIRWAGIRNVAQEDWEAGGSECRMRVLAHAQKTKRCISQTDRLRIPKLMLSGRGKQQEWLASLSSLLSLLSPLMLLLLVLLSLLSVLLLLLRMFLLLLLTVVVVVVVVAVAVVVGVECCGCGCGCCCCCWWWLCCCCCCWCCVCVCCCVCC